MMFFIVKNIKVLILGGLMIRINENFLNLKDNYLFSTINQKIEQYKKEYPDRKIIRLGIGDVTKPLPLSITKAMEQACMEMNQAETFKGYGPEQGYEFLREKIQQEDYEKKGIQIDKDEIFISDGAKCDTANITDLFANANTVAITDPVYPVYLDSNIIAGRTKIIYLPCTKDNNFVPELPKEKCDIIYLCYPNNPTGTVLTKEQLKIWVDYAKENKAILLFDSAYERYITQKDIPHSIYEIEGAKEVAIEFRSFSKTAGFTGIRCAYVVIPKELMGYTKQGKEISINGLWKRRSSCKFNGVSYITQRGAEAIYTEEGQKGIEENIRYYQENARLLKEGLQELGYEIYGGVNSPYIWLKIPKSQASWQFFDELLMKANVVGTPGSGFGLSGEGYFRLTAFGKREEILEAMEKMKRMFE